MDEDEDYACDMTEEELFELTEKLLDNDENNCAKFFRYNYQERRCGEEDVCDEPLFSDVDEALFEVPTIRTLMALHDNYNPLVTEEEEVTREEIKEEQNFIDSIVDTKVTAILMEFLVDKKLIAPDNVMAFKRMLHRMWFALYPRSRRTKGSCAFEHVFLGEVKNGKVNGFHNWLFFLLEEQRGDVNYYGFSKGFSFGRGRGGILKTIFEWEGSIKPVSSIFMGLSPELEMALYTLSVLIKPDDACEISLGGKRIEIRNHVFKQDGKKYLGTAFPDI